MRCYKFGTVCRPAAAAAVAVVVQDSVVTVCRPISVIVDIVQDSAL